MQMAALPNEILGFIDIPVTTVKISRYRVFDLNLMIHFKNHTHQPEKFQRIIAHSQDIKQKNKSSEVNHIDLYKSPMLNNTVFNVQQSQKKAPRVLPPLPDSKENLLRLKNLHFHYCDLNDSQYIQRSKKLVENKHCYATQRNDVATFRIRLKPDATLQTKRPSKNPNNYCDKVETLSDDTCENGITNQIGSTLHRKPNYGTTFQNPLIIEKSIYYIKIKLDARHLNSNTDQSP